MKALPVKSSNYSHLEEFIKASKMQEGWNSLGSAWFTARVESMSPAGKDSSRRGAVTRDKDNPDNLHQSPSSPLLSCPHAPSPWPIPEPRQQQPLICWRKRCPWGGISICGHNFASLPLVARRSRSPEPAWAIRHPSHHPDPSQKRARFRVGHCSPSPSKLRTPAAS